MLLGVHTYAPSLAPPVPDPPLADHEMPSADVPDVPDSPVKSSEKRVVWAERVVETRRRDRTANNARAFLFEAEDAAAKFRPSGKTERTPIGRVALSMAKTDFGQVKYTYIKIALDVGPILLSPIDFCGIFRDDYRII